MDEERLNECRWLAADDTALITPACRRALVDLIDAVDQLTAERDDGR